jgi:polyhydroxybutyrate depolymerase
LRHVTVRGLVREYWLTVPDGYTGDDPVPLVVDYHGQGSNARQQMLLTRMRREAGARGWVVVTPEARDGNWLRPADVDFTRIVLRDVARRLCIDPDRRFADGMSQGAGMVVDLGCLPRPVFRAIAPVAGVNVRLPCAEAPTTAILAISGTADDHVPYAGGEYPEVPRVMAAWAARNECASGPFPVRLTPHVTQFGYRGCVEPVRWLRVRGGGHSWPGGPILPRRIYGATNQEIDATARILNFFEWVSTPA